MLSFSLDALLKLSKTTSPKKLLDYDCITLYISFCEGTFNYTKNISISEYSLWSKIIVAKWQIFLPNNSKFAVFENHWQKKKV